MIESVIVEEPEGELHTPELHALVGEVEEQLAVVRGVANAAVARTTELMARLLRTGGWNQGGIRTPAHYLVWKCAVSRAEANRIVAVARRVGAYPTCAALFDTGELSLEQVHIICACAPPTWADAAIANHARLMSTRQLHHVLANYAWNEPGTPEDRAERDAAGGDGERGDGARISMGERDGRWHLNADLPLDLGAQVEAAFTACLDDLIHQHHTTSNGTVAAGRVTEPHRPTLADAFGEMAERALAHGATTRPHHDRYRIVWHHSVDPTGRPVLRHHQGDRTHEWMRRLLCCDPTITPVIETPPPRDTTDQLLGLLRGGTPVAVGRSQRIVPDRLRRLIEHRDGGCIIPGCAGHDRYLVIHHITHWEDGGPTDPANLVAICPHHHRELHHGQLAITGNATQPAGLTIKDRHGRTLTGAAHVKPPDQPPPQAATTAGLHVGTWQHPLGERLRYDNVYYHRSA